MNDARQLMRGVLLRLLFWLPLLTAAAWAWGWHYADFWLSWYARVLDAALPDFGVVYLGIGLGREYVFETQVIAERSMLLHGQLVSAGFTVDASTPMYGALVHPLVLVTAALVWPLPDWRARLLRLLLSLPCLLLLATLDTPLVLASAINDLLSYTLDPVADTASWRVDWTRVMDGGGRFALSLALAGMAALVQTGLTRAIRRTA